MRRLQYQYCGYVSREKRKPFPWKHGDRSFADSSCFLGGGSDRVKIDKDDQIFCGVEDGFLMTPEGKKKFKLGDLLRREPGIGYKRG